MDFTEDEIAFGKRVISQYPDDIRRKVMDNLRWLIERRASF